MSIGTEVVPDPDGDPEQIYLEQVGPVRALRIGGVLNARDVGGLVGERGRVRTGRLVRSACLENLTAEGAETLAGLGVNTVIDLRTPLERVEHPNRVADLEDVAEVNVELLKTLAELDALPPNSPRELYQYLVDTCGRAAGARALPRRQGSHRANRRAAAGAARRAARRDHRRLRREQRGTRHARAHRGSGRRARMDPRRARRAL